MPDDAAPAPDAAGSAAKIFSLKGWIVVGAIVFLEAAFFVTLLYFMDKPLEKVEAEPEKTAGLNPEDLTRTVAIDPLTYTIFTPGSGSGTLRLVVVLELGITREERDSRQVPTNEQLEVFRTIVTNYIDRLRDHLNSYIPRLGVSHLQGPNAQQYITDEIRRFINDGLKEMDIPNMPPAISRDRVTRVLVREFMYQPN